ncbi:MAG: acyltransferase [Abyssibacter sp.]|nr:acyltransferase [Abyssibacter sp.]
MLLVVTSHLAETPVPGGFVGVDIFFVISGFLVTRTLLGELDARGRIDFPNFYARRVKRLVPSLLAMVGLVYLASCLLLASSEFFSFTNSSFYALTWTSNIYFPLQEFGYFEDQSGRDLFRHTWSLGVEEQFYLIWPALIASAAVLDRAGPSRNTPLFRYFFAISALSFAGCLLVSRIDTNWAFYSMPTRLWQLAAGAMLVSLMRGPIPSRVLGAIIGAIGWAAIAAACAVLDEQSQYPTALALLPTLGACCLIYSGGRGSVMAAALSFRPLRWLGDRSYSIYLWHWPIIILVATFGFATPVAHTASILLTLLFAAANFKWLERPFWKGRLSAGPDRRWLLAGTLASLSLVVAIKHGGRPTWSTPAPSSLASNALASRSDLPPIYDMGCDTWYQSDEVRGCRFAMVEAAERTVVLLGDSIALQWFPALIDTFLDPETEVIVFTKSSCPMVDEDFFYDRIGAVFELCTSWRRRVLEIISRIQPDVVVVGSSPRYGYSDNEWLNGSGRVLEQLATASTQVLAIAGTPSLPDNGPSCLLRWDATPLRKLLSDANGMCGGNSTGSRANHVAALIRQAADRLDNVHLLNLNPLACPDGNCMAITARDVIVYRDQSHLTASYVRSVAPDVRKSVRSILDAPPKR